MKLSWRRLFDLQWKTIYGVNGEHSSPYLTRILIGRFRIHIFHRGDIDPDFHDHPWGFWTFPLTSYVEAVLDDPVTGEHHLGIVQRFKLHYRPATYSHRVLHALAQGYDINGKVIRPRKIYTLVWRQKETRKWGFWKLQGVGRTFKSCWVYWKDYIYGDGKYTPC